MSNISEQQNPDEYTICIEPDQLLDLIEGIEENPQALTHIQSCDACAANFATFLETWALARQAQLQTSRVDPAHLMDYTAEHAVFRQTRKIRMFVDVLRTWLSPPRLLSAGVAAAILGVVLLSGTFFQGQTARLGVPDAEIQVQLEQARRKETRTVEELASARRNIQVLDNQKRKASLRSALQEQRLHNLLASSRNKEQAYQERESILKREMARLRLTRATPNSNLTPSAQQLVQQIASAREDLSRGTVLGGVDSAAPDIELYAPVGVIVPSRRVNFRWQAGSAGVSYVVHIQTSSDNPVLDSPSLSAANWTHDVPFNTPSVPFYKWRVTASDGKQSWGERFLVLDTSRLPAGK